MLNGKRKRSSSPVPIIVTLLSILFVCAVPVRGEILFQHDFETGWGDWSASNGVWEVGVPTYGPGSSHSLPNCAGTNLDGVYPKDTDSRLESPLLELPSIDPASEEIVLRFWHWFSYALEYYDDDRGRIQVWTSDDGWTDLHTVAIHSSVWSPFELDLTAYSGQHIRLGFLHVDYSDFYGHHEWAGWYIDDVVVRAQPVQLFDIGSVEDFDSDWNDWWWNGWWVANGVWQVGEPVSGPDSSASPPNCAGTVLDGTYPKDTDSFLISPKIDLPDDSFELRVRFWHWFSYSTEYYSDDQGQVYIQTFDFESRSWSDWDLLHTVYGTSGDWSPLDLDILAYAGERVRIGFFHVDYSDFYGHHESWGWYIDNFKIIHDSDLEARPDVKVNGLDGTVLVSPGENVTVTVELDPRSNVGVVCDWWVCGFTPFGNYWFRSPTRIVKSNQPVLLGQWPLMQVPETVILDRTMPEGVYTFYFILDDIPDGNLDITWYDCVDVIVGD